MRNTFKRILPRWLQYGIYRFIWNPVRRTFWKALGLECTLRSGIRLRVLSHPDWVIYNEVVVNGEYDEVIDAALTSWSRGSPLRVVDLGANVGYFSFRFADMFFQRFPGSGDLQLTLVEGSPTVFRQLQRRVEQEPLLRGKTRLIHGLVGRRDGGAYIEQGYIHYGHGASTERAWGAKFVPYIDLTNALGDTKTIDLLKCDVEGAEFDLIENYPSLFERVRSAVLEFHYYGRDVDRARNSLFEFGFRQEKVLSAVEPCSVEYFVR